MIDLTKITWKSVVAFLRQLAAVVGLVVAVGNTDHLPTSVRVAVTAVSGALLTAEHYAQSQVPPLNPPTSSGTP